MVKAKFRVIGVAGTNGSGKDTFCQMLAKYHDYLFISVTDLLRAECTRRKLPLERENLREISAEWRRELGLGVLVDKAIAEYQVVKGKYIGLVVASLRNPGEVDRIHQLGGSSLWLDADPRVRYNRVQANKASRNRSAEDNKTYEQFLAEEEAEMHPSGDLATLNMSAVKAKCDIFLDNDSKDPLAFRKQAEKTLGLIG